VSKVVAVDHLRSGECSELNIQLAGTGVGEQYDVLASAFPWLWRCTSTLEDTEELLVDVECG